MEKNTKKDTKKRYVALSIKSVDRIQLLKVNRNARTLTEDKLHNDTESILLDCTKAELEHLFSQINKGYKIDFTLVCGKVSYYFEKSDALAILKFQEECLKNLENAQAEFKYAVKNSGSMVTIRKAELKVERVRKNITKRVLNYIKKHCKDSIIPYAFVELYDLCDYNGSYYISAEANDLTLEEICKHDRFATGVVDVNNFVKRLNNLGYVEGINSDNTSITKPIEFMEESYDRISESYFGFAIPHSTKALRGRSKNK